MERRYQVFVSSTYRDLIDERREVIQAVLEMESIPAGMEMFPSANEDQWTLIQEVIQQSDYYLVIVGGKYGSTTAEGISYTEKEYDYAVALDIPIMGFVHASPDQIPRGLSETDPESSRKLDAFREKVMTRMVKTYSSPAELGSVVSRALNRMIRHNPRDGWVRGNEAMTDETRATIAELKATVADFEKAQAEKKVSEKSTPGIDTSYKHGADTTDVDIRYSGFSDGESKAYKGGLTYTWDEIVETLGPFMIDEATEPRLRKLLEEHLLADIRSGRHGIESLQSANLHVTDGAWGDVIIQLRALSIIELGTKKRTVSDKAVYYTLTPAGDAYLVGLRAVKRVPESSE